MYRGFPYKMINLLRCPDDEARLVLANASSEVDAFITGGTLQCSTCGSTYEIANGIVRFLKPETLDALEEQERLSRDQGTEGLDTAWETSEWSELEIQPTIAASEPLARAITLELGAGTGRYTARMADRGASIIAVDFSLRGLEYLAARTQPFWDIGLVWADVTRLRVAARAFDLIASTLVSNLTSVESRAKMLRTAARACKPNGKFVFSTHYYGIRSRLHREPRAGYYVEAPTVFRYLFRRHELAAEARAFFEDVSVYPIRVVIPFARAAGLNILRLSKLGQHIPIVNLLGDLLLAVAQRPASAPDERVLSQVSA